MFYILFNFFRKKVDIIYKTIFLFNFFKVFLKLYVTLEVLFHIKNLI